MTEYLIEATCHDGDGTTVLRAAKLGMTTAPLDTPPHTCYPRRLLDPGSFSRAIPLADGSQTGASRQGSIILANNGLVGAVGTTLDDWIGHAFAGWPVVIRRGANPGLPYPDNYPVIATLIQDSVAISGADMEITVRDRLAGARDKAVQTQSYTGGNVLPDGNGGVDPWLEGTEDDLRGKHKPRLLSAARNITPPCVNTSLVIFQVSDDAVTVTACHDAGASLTEGARHAALDDLRTINPGAGHWNWYAGPEGTFVRVNFSAERIGAFTCDAQAGDTDVHRTVSAIVAALLTGPGEMSAADLVASSFSALAVAAPAPVDAWVGTERAVIGEVIDALLPAVGGWLLPNASGQMDVGQYQGVGSPTGASTQYQVHGDPAVTLPSPVWRVVVEYARNWTVQTEGLPGAVTEARRAWLAKEYRQTAPAENAAILASHPGAIDLTVRTMLRDRADADALRDATLALFSAPAMVLSLQVPEPRAAAIPIGSTVTLRLDRFGLADGRDFVVVGEDIDLADEMVTLTLRGRVHG